MMNTKRGRGRIYQRGNIYWIQYFFNGQDRRESTHSSDRSVAEKLLTKRMAAKDKGTLTEGQIKPRKFEDLRAAIERDYRLQENDSIDRMQLAFKALSTKFAGWRTNAITDTEIDAYVDDRLASGMAKATIVYELRMLKRSFKLAKVPAPSFPSIELKNIRQEEFNPEQFQAVLAHLPPYLKPVMEAAYLTGWRTQSELLPLQWKNVNFNTGIITLPIGSTKSGESRTYPFGQFPPLLALLKAQRAATDALQQARNCIVPHVFYRVEVNAIKPILSYKTAWKAATERAGLPGRWVHDFRRCGARALRDAAVPESVAMSLLGHKTPSMFRRYQITNNADQRAGVEKLAAYHAQQVKLRDNLQDKTPIPFPKIGASQG